ncbi:hypothetical protein [Acetohalobium arabaticum]|nr:hypothetical protein [Acetohalobium arabaticum]
MRANEAGGRMSGKRRIHIDYSCNIMMATRPFILFYLTAAA